PAIIEGAIEQARKKLDFANIQIDLLTLETCESDLLYQKELYNTSFRALLRSHLRAIYTPVGSLAYRNVDWNNILYYWLKADPGKNPETLFQILKTTLADVPNYIYND